MFRVFIDPGHGGEDPGAVGPTGVKEKDLNMQMGDLLSLACRRKGWDVMWSRSGDYNVSELASAQKANAWNADVYVSLHANGASDPSAKGFEVLYWHTSDTGEVLADEVMIRLLESLPFRNFRGSKPRTSQDRGATVLSKTAMPAIIVEPGFVTNPEEETHLQRFIYQAAIAYSIVRAIEQVYFKKEEM